MEDFSTILIIVQQSIILYFIFVLIKEFKEHVKIELEMVKNIDYLIEILKEYAKSSRKFSQRLDSEDEDN